MPAEPGCAILLAHLVVEEPLLVQRIDGAVGLERGNRGIDRGDEIGTLGEDEAEIFSAERAARSA